MISFAKCVQAYACYLGILELFYFLSFLFSSTIDTMVMWLLLHYLAYLHNICSRLIVCIKVIKYSSIVVQAYLLDWINAGNIKFLPVLQCTNSSHNVKTSTSLLELGKRLFQPEVPLWPPWEVPGSSSEELLDSNLALSLVAKVQLSGFWMEV